MVATIVRITGGFPTLVPIFVASALTLQIHSGLGAYG
jgi:hypothetical protein